MQRTIKKDRPPCPPTKTCKKCGQTLPTQQFAMHLQCCDNYSALLVNSYPKMQMPYKSSWRHDDEDYSDEQVHCPNCKDVMKGKQYRKHKKLCYFQEECRFCRIQMPQEALCRKNPVAKEIRKQCPSSSDQPDSSDQQQQWQMDEDYYYHPRPKNARATRSSSQEQQRLTKEAENNQRLRQGPFHHRPKRQYTLSQSSSEQDEHQKFWRTFHESFSEVPSQFYIRSFSTNLPGITIVVSSQGRNGRILRRTVYNDQTGQSQIISNHRFQRHYRAHVIENQGNMQMLVKHSSGSLLQISNNRHLSTQQLAQIIEHLSEQAKRGLNQQELSQLDRSKVKQLGKDQKCIICYQQYEQDESIITLKCKHFFHEQCIIQWLVQSPLCPLCKSRQK